MLQKSNSTRPSLAKLLASNPHRFDRFSRRLPGVLLDFSRTAVTDGDFSRLVELAELAGVPAARDRLFAGEPINLTEQRAVLHPLWRARNFSDHLAPREAAECTQSVALMESISGTLHQGFLPPGNQASGEIIRHVIHVGIGGSLLGPRLLCDAFAGPGTTPQVHFISSVDAFERERLLACIDPVETVIVLVSKSFTTSEVLAHAKRLQRWQRGVLDRPASVRRLFAVTAAIDKAVAFGILPEHVMQMGEWTGGRFSLWSPVGLSAAITMGPKAFGRLCSGGAAMDRHFREAPVEQNLPMVHALLSCWHRNVCGYPCRGIIPYDSRLHGLPAWLQQVQMESNGKSVSRGGKQVGQDTSPVVLGDCGTDAQHALFQAFHQGTEIVPLDFIGVIQPDHADFASQAELLSHLLAQASALAVGRDPEQTAAQMATEGKSSQQIRDLLPHRVMPGNRPSNILLLDALKPENLGMLLVLYEHSVFVESVIWDINSFDQWGVELGKVMAGNIELALTGKNGSAAHGIAGLEGLVSHIREILRAGTEARNLGL